MNRHLRPGGEKMSIATHRRGEPGGTTMASKDRGGRNSKKTAAKDLKQKRLERKSKKDALGRDSK
jgi:hypothetical protein